MGHQGTSRLANLPNDQAPPLAPQWMTDNAHKQGPSQWHQEGNAKEAPWMHETRQDKMGWQEDKSRAPDARWDKQPVSPFPERPQPSFVDDALIGGLRPGGPQTGSKWREDGDRVLPRRDAPAPTRWGHEEPRWMNDGPPLPKNDIFGGGAERWGEQKGQGRGRGALVDPGRRGPPRDGFTDRWVGGPGEEPSPGGRPPRLEKWGPEGEPHDPTADRWGHRPPGAPFPPPRGNPGGFMGPAAGFNEPHHVHQPLEPGRGRGFAAGRGRSMLPKGIPQAPGVPSHWGGVPGPSVAPTMLEVLPLGSKSATHKYNKKAAVVIYKKLAAARRVILPAGVSQEDQTLFAGADQPDPMDVLAGIHDPGNGGELAPAPAVEKPAVPAVPPPAPAAASDRPQAAKAEAAPAQQKAEEPRPEPDTAVEQHSEQGPGATDAGEDKWIYLDPTGTEQGPFPREDILGWFNDKYFDERLRIRPENSPGSFRELSVMLKAWDWAKLQKTPPSSEQANVSQEPEQPAAQSEQREIQQVNNAMNATSLNDTGSSDLAPHFSHGLPPVQPQTSRFEQVFAQSQARPAETLQQQPSDDPAFGRHPSGLQPGLQHLQQPHQSQELPRLPDSLIHPEGFMSGINGGHPIKMPGMEGWTGGHGGLPMDQWQPRLQQQPPQHPPPPQQQQQQTPQQQQGMGQEFAHHHLPFAQQLFPQPQPKPPGASIGLEQIQDPRFQRAFEEERQRMRDAEPGAGGLQSWLGQGGPPAQQPGPGHGLGSWGPGTPGFPLPQPEALHGQRPSEHSHLDHPGQLQSPLQHLHPGQHGGFPGGFPGGHLPQYQHSVLQPPQHPQPLAQPSADPVIDPTHAARAPSGPIGASLESRGSSSSNLAAQASQPPRQPQLPPALAGLAHLMPMARDTQQPPHLPPPVSASQHQMSSQAPAQHLFAEMPIERKPVDEDRNVQRPSMPAPCSQEPSQETQLGQAHQPSQQEHRPEELVSAVPVPFEKVKHKKPKAKAAVQPPLEALQPFEQRRQQQQAAQPEPRHVPIPPPPPPPPTQPEAPPPPAAFDSKPAPWAHKRPAAVPGQRSILDIQKEEAERTRAQREAAEKAAAAAGLPAPGPAAGGWAKIAGGGTGHSNAFVEDEATKRAIAASLRDQREHEERVRRQQSGGSQGAPREMLGANGTPAVLQGATLGHALKSKITVRQAPSALPVWSASAAGQKGAAAKLQEVQARETEQQRKSQQKTGSKGAPAKAQGNDEDEEMFWDYPKAGKAGAATSAAASKANGAAQKPNGVQAADGAFGTTMSPEFKEWCRQQMLKLSNKDDLTLVEFLMSCQSSGETAEYISAYLGKSSDVASFTAEFIRRKAAQLSGGKSAKPQAPPGVEKKHPDVTAAGAGGGVPAATGWQKPAAKSAKKKGKGRKADATMLGFAAGLDYNAFERPET